MTIKYIFTVQINVPDGQEFLISGGGLTSTYQMVQMHFHWAAEHTLNGRR